MVEPQIRVRGDSREGRPGESSLGVVVCESIADAEGVSTTDLAPLNDYVDVDALESIFSNGSDDGPLSVRFSAYGYTVIVEDPDSVLVDECA